MRTIAYPARFTAIVSTALLGIGSLTATPAASAKAPTQTLHFYEVTTGATSLTAAGKVVPGGLTHEPKPGQMFDVVANLYSGSHGKHGTKVVGTDHVVCTFIKTTETICDAQGRPRRFAAHRHQPGWDRDRLPGPRGNGALLRLGRHLPPPVGVRQQC